MDLPLRLRTTMAATAVAPSCARTALVAGAIAALLSGCGSVEWVKTRFVEPKPATASAPPAAPAPNRAAPATGAPSAPRPAAPAPAQEAAVPVAPKAGAPAAAAPAAVPRAATGAPAARPLTAPVPPRAEADLAPGRFAVQVAAFMTPASAEASRSRTITRLRAAARPEADATRVLQMGGRYVVLVGDFAERAQAEAAAEQLRATLRQDLLIFRR